MGKSKSNAYESCSSAAEEFVDDDDSYQGWKHLIPLRADSKNPKTLPLVTAGLFSYCTAQWMTGIVNEAYKRDLTPDDLYDTSWKDSSDYNCKRFERIWKMEVETSGKKSASIERVVLKMIWPWLLAAFVFGLGCAVTPVVGQIMPLQIILESVQNGEDEKHLVYLTGMAVLLTSGFFFRQIFLHLLTQITTVQGIRVRGGILSFLFKKILSNRNSENKSVGELVNLCANDGQRLFDMIYHGVQVPICFVTMLASLYGIYLVGLWALLGIGIYMLFIPIQVSLSRLVFILRGKVIPITEERVKLVSEIITAIKLVKMYAWEKSFAKKISDIRSREKRVLEHSIFIESIMVGLAILIPIAPAMTYLAIILTGNELRTSQAFAFLTLLTAVRYVLVQLPMSLKALVEGMHACQRIKVILIAEEAKVNLLLPRQKTNILEITNCYFGWKVDSQDYLTDDKVEVNRRTDPERKPLLHQDINKESKCDESDSRTVITLHDITLTLRQGSLLGICGSVGSGKTSLIQAILGMMTKEGGEIAIDQSKAIAYVAQQAWIMNATVKENILFGHSYDPKWYAKVVEACALLSDFDQLPGGDETEIGERGINLSGGQKQRISIARAVYSNSDVILLDDPLSAVDAHVGQHIFTNCLKGLLMNKTVLFATHQLQFLSDCDYILVIQDGRIAEEGTHSGLMSMKQGEYSNLIKTFHQSDADEEQAADILLTDTVKLPDGVPHEPIRLQGKRGYISDEKLLDKTHEGHSLEPESGITTEKTVTAGVLTQPEKARTGSIKFSTFRSYAKAGGGLWTALLIVLMAMVTAATQAFSNFWLATWLREQFPINEPHVGGTENMTSLERSAALLPHKSHVETFGVENFYPMIYGITLLGLLIFTVIRSYSIVKITMKAASRLHDQVFERVINSPMSFFDVTPSGQILNKFSHDLDSVDTMLPAKLDQFTFFLGMISISVIIIMAVYVYLVIVLVVVIVILYFLYRVGKRGIQGLKRIDKLTRSPLYSHIATTVQGLSTIKAYQKEQQFYKRFHMLQDRNNMSQLLFLSAIKWVSTRGECLALLIVLSASLFVVLVPSTVISPTLAPLVLLYAAGLSGMIQYAIRLGIETEAEFLSVESMLNYIDNLLPEAPSIVEHRRPENDWPQHGSIQFCNVDVRYRYGLPLVLKNVSFDIGPQEKIGIVGRTGSGKSSLTLILYRIMELAGGSITIDGVDISSIGLEDLRSRLSIIPQDPVLFVGTVRYNLDPFTKYSDTELWSALKKCHVDHTIKALDGQLDASIVENGENFSVGERQLLCMARALLRHSKILLLDEATAAIDTETDALVQRTIKEAFADCTMLTIAHRLNTVSGYDRIMVLNNGEVIEFDTPSNLMTREDSLFAQMMAVSESQKTSAMS